MASKEVFMNLILGSRAWIEVLVHRNNVFHVTSTLHYMGVYICISNCDIYRYRLTHIVPFKKLNFLFLKGSRKSYPIYFKGMFGSLFYENRLIQNLKIIFYETVVLFKV